MDLTHSFFELLAHFAPVFTEPTFNTFLQICSGWTLSHRHRFITDVIFSGTTRCLHNAIQGDEGRCNQFSHSTVSLPSLLEPELQYFSANSGKENLLESGKNGVPKRGILA